MKLIRTGRPLRVFHVALLAGMAESSVRWNAAKGRIPHYRDPRTPKMILFQPEAVDAFLATRKPLLRRSA